MSLYCEYLIANAFRFECENGYNAWKEALYNLVTSVIQVLRLDFENNKTPMEIELVIYFY